jgi:hypothetical protein
MADLDFFYNGMEVGYFEGAAYPRKNGKYRYMPYRGPGHYEMQTERRAGGSPRCYYDLMKERVLFTILDCPEYGILQLTDFEITNIN